MNRQPLPNTSRYDEALAQPATHPYRTGYADAVMRRECRNPFSNWRAAALYLQGYMDGEDARLRDDCR